MVSRCATGWPGAELCQESVTRADVVLERKESATPTQLRHFDLHLCYVTDNAGGMHCAEEEARRSGMSNNDGPALGEVILAGVRGVRSQTPLCPADSVKEFVSLPETSRPAGSVALDFTCDRHGERLMRLWMSPPQAGDATFGGEGIEGAWDTDASDRGAVVVTCTRQGCRNSARLTNDWLMASLRQVRTDFEAGKGLPIAWFPLSKVSASSR